MLPFPQIYTYKRAVCVCLFVCFLSATLHLSTLRRCLRVAESRSRRGRPRARGQACTARARTRMPYNFSTKKSYADACLLFESYRIVFFTNRVCWPPWNHGEPGDLPLTSHFKQNYWQEETSYLIFGRSRPWSASIYIYIYTQPVEALPGSSDYR